MIFKRTGIGIALVLILSNSAGSARAEGSQEGTRNPALEQTVPDSPSVVEGIGEGQPETGPDRPPVGGGNEEGSPGTVREGTIPDQFHGAVRGGIRGMARRIDRFFSDEYIEEELQTTRLRFIPRVEWSRGGEAEFRVPFKFKLVLPGVKRKWKLFVGNMVDPDNDLNPNITDTRVNELDGSQEADTSSFLGIERDVFTKIRQSLKLRSGIKVRFREVNPFAWVRYRYTAFFSVWTLRVTEKVYWFGDTGFGERTTLEWDRPLLDQAMQLRLTTTGTWAETSAGLELVQSLEIRRLIREGMAISLSYQVAAHFRPTKEVDSHTIGVGWRQRFLRDWMFLDIQPQVRYLETEDYRPSAVLFASVEIIF